MNALHVRDIIRPGDMFSGSLNAQLTGIQHDSRKVEPGNLFIAVRGAKADGHSFIRQALGKGAVAIVYEQGWPELEAFLRDYPAVAWIGVNDSREALACCAALFHRAPSSEIGVVGITGTNGKTTTSYILKAILEAWQHKVGLIGTINYMVGDRVYAASHTTPEAADFQKLLRTMADAGCGYAVSEVSSHALAQRRVDGTRFRAAVFTNLTRDHLDFHVTMDAYFHAKKRLFLELLTPGGIAAVNIDDEYGRTLVELLRSEREHGKDIRILTYAMDNQEADVYAIRIDPGFDHTSFTFRIRTSEGERSLDLESPMIGTTNVLNVLAAVTVAIGLRVPDSALKAGIKSAEAVSGRFERVAVGQRYLAIIDYAHTEDALQRLLQNARALLDLSAAGRRPARGTKRDDNLFLPHTNGQGRIITVFGCGGDRDRGKRPQMGEIASRLSYFVILTSDNPRFEDPKAIVHEIEAGIRKDNYIIIHDRRAAIVMAVELASPGDIIVVAGKGHEDYQEIKGTRHHFSDREVLEEAIRRSLERHARRTRRTKRTSVTGAC
ncbi:MAG TPA: UDP-N-acetylmuramoyl-L-alanyl-D-glutamate--2,6-diaminopimelate ligase [Dissulfurispiraceae bacterium]|nr:UDP-N-acetylmuramoyl-L-alanyl-D-glutamate--2,6-diaminopimelate ligase [Dissulfurispiraceae bacterium]